LSEKDLNVDKSMNTNLHAMEALSNYILVRQDSQVQNALKASIDTILEHIINKRNGHFYLFFNKDWSPVGELISYGHDIEGVWLIREAISRIPRYYDKAPMKALLHEMGKATLQEGIDSRDGACYNEGIESGVIHDDKDWRPQAEALVGFLELYLLTDDSEYLSTADRIWEFIEIFMVDRDHRGWFWSTDAQGKPLNLAKAGPWQCPYHSSRCCWEAMDRITGINNKK